MSIIYEPTGKAREYSPLALNIYNGCDHDCSYCYCKRMQYIDFTTNVQPRQNLIENLSKELNRTQYSNQVLLCFTGDLYCKANDTFKETRSVLMKLWLKNIPVAILSKGGKRILQDLDIIKKFKCIKVGATLTCDNNQDSIKYEPGAALPSERLETLKILHQNGIKTWISIEPVLFPKQSLNLIEQCLDFVDQFKVGKLNHIQNSTDWHKFLINSVTLLRKNNKQFYIKDDLAKFSNGFKLEQHETNPDYLFLKTTHSTQLSIL